MKKMSFNGIFRKRVLLFGAATSIVLALGSLAFIKLNGAAHYPSTDVAVSNTEAFEVPVISSSTQVPPQETAAQSLHKPDTAMVSPTAESETATGSFQIVHETTCIPDRSEYQVASVVAVVDTDRLSVSIDGESFTVKFLGVNTQLPNTEIMKVVFSANEILIGKMVALVADETDTDDDGNLLRYVFTEDTFINLALLESGLAVLSDTSSLEACEAAFEAAQDAAQLQESGVWERLKPEEWREWPVVPVISENALEIYLSGLNAGTDPKLFSIIGDCQNIPGGSLFRRVTWDDFSLPSELEYLQPTLENFRSIWSREPITVDGGFIPASMFSTYWTNSAQCDPLETPLDCEFRLNNASIVLIGLGSDQKPGTGDDFDHYMRKIVEYSLEKHVLPILATDAYATEEGFPLNQIVAQIAYDYDIPLWNFWAAVQDLTNEGLKEDNFHISSEAFAVRRITGLQVLHAVLDAAQQ